MNKKVIFFFVSLIITSITLFPYSAIAQQSKIVNETFYAPSLEENLLGDSPNQSIVVHLPSSYETEIDKHYPVAENFRIVVALTEPITHFVPLTYYYLSEPSMCSV